MIKYATGFNISADELSGPMTLRWMALQRATQLLAGWTHADDHCPPCFYNPLPDGPYAGKKIDPTAEEKSIQEAFTARGWDTNGIPTSETLTNLGLAFLEPSMASLRQATFEEARQAA